MDLADCRDAKQRNHPTNQEFNQGVVAAEQNIVALDKYPKENTRNTVSE